MIRLVAFSRLDGLQIRNDSQHSTVNNVPTKSLKLESTKVH